MQRRVWLAVAALALGGCGDGEQREYVPAEVGVTTYAPSAAVKAAAGSIRTRGLDGQSVTVAEPATRSDRAVIFFHGARQSQTAAFGQPGRSDVTAALLTEGYAVAASSAHGLAWGNEASQQDYLELIEQLRSDGYQRFYFLAESMGGLPSLRVAAQAQPRAWAAFYPVCDASSLSMPGAPADPLVMPPAGLPVQAWASDADTVVPVGRNADLCARGNVVRTRGDHGDLSNFDPAAVVRFFDAAG